MFHRWAALVLVLALCAFTPKNAAGQQPTTQPRERGAGSLGKAFPNPVNPETHIHFAIGDPPACAVVGTHRTTIQILNILAQLVAIPVFEGPTTTATSTTAGGLGPISNLQLTCGQYSAFWNGNILNTGREAPSGTYVVRLMVDGKTVGTSKIFVSK
ncbi:MAG: hypothetical protein ACHQWU_13135 [Gemmatimonadales bacterium]